MNLSEVIYNAVCDFERQAGKLDKFEPENDFQVFWEPAAWKERGEEYGHDSDLIVVHDGGTYAPYFNYEYGDHPRYSHMHKVLNKLNCWAEPATSWYTVIYQEKPAKKEVTLDTLSVVHAYDVLDDLHPRHQEIFWAMLDKHVSYGDAKFTLINALTAISILTAAGNEYAEEIGSAYGWTVPHAMYADNAFFAING